MPENNLKFSETKSEFEYLNCEWQTKYVILSTYGTWKVEKNVYLF